MNYSIFTETAYSNENDWASYNTQLYGWMSQTLQSEKKPDARISMWDSICINYLKTQLVYNIR